MKKLVVAGLVCASSLFVCGFAVGQKAASNRPLLAEFATASANVEMNAMDSSKYKDAPKKLADLYSKIVLDPDAARQVLAFQIGDYERGKMLADSAPQRSQIANEVTVELAILQCAQNQRIIELLEKQKK